METIILNGKAYQLDIEQAKKLNLLKEKSDRVRSWEEFKEKYCNECGYFYEAHKNRAVKTSSPISMCNQLTPHESQALVAFTKLLKLRRDWIGEWEPDWEDIDASYGVIWIHKNKLQANIACTPSRSLSFPDYEMAKEFLKTFRGLIEEAKILI